MSKKHKLDPGRRNSQCNFLINPSHRAAQREIEKPKSETRNQKNGIFSVNLNFEFFCTDYLILKLIEAGATHWVISKIVHRHVDVALKNIFGTSGCKTCLKHIANLEMQLEGSNSATTTASLTTTGE